MRAVTMAIPTEPWCSRMPAVVMATGKAVDTHFLEFFVVTVRNPLPAVPMRAPFVVAHPTRRDCPILG